MLEEKPAQTSTKGAPTSKRTEPSNTVTSYNQAGDALVAIREASARLPQLALARWKQSQDVVEACLGGRLAAANLHPIHTHTFNHGASRRMAGWRGR